MNYNKVFLASVIFLLLFPVTYSLADAKFKFEDQMNDGNSLFFLVELEEDDEIEIDLRARENGYFHLYLFDERPTETHVNMDNTIDSDIKKDKVAHDSGGKPDINYTAEDDQIYYLQSRGLTDNEAKKILTQGFILEIFDIMKNLKVDSEIISNYRNQALSLIVN